MDTKLFVRLFILIFFCCSSHLLFADHLKTEDDKYVHVTPTNEIVFVATQEDATDFNCLFRSIIRGWGTPYMIFSYNNMLLTHKEGKLLLSAQAEDEPDEQRWVACITAETWAIVQNHKFMLTHVYKEPRDIETDSLEGIL